MLMIVLYSLLHSCVYESLFFLFALSLDPVCVGIDKMHMMDLVALSLTAKLRFTRHFSSTFVDDGTNEIPRATHPHSFPSLQSKHVLIDSLHVFVPQCFNILGTIGKFCILRKRNAYTVPARCFVAIVIISFFLTTVITTISRWSIIAICIVICPFITTTSSTTNIMDRLLLLLRRHIFYQQWIPLYAFTWLEAH